jgi:transcriptional regulator with XRE-family HTH domain
MSGTSTRKKTPPRKRETTPLWKRVGAYVKKRREELGLSQGDIIDALGYKSRNAVSNIEVGIEGLPAKRIYDWADILEVPRDAFFKFATGDVANLQAAQSASQDSETEVHTAAEQELLKLYRGLPPKFQKRLRDQASELGVLASVSAAPQRKTGRNGS